VCQCVRVPVCLCVRVFVCCIRVCIEIVEMRIQKTTQERRVKETGRTKKGQRILLQLRECA